MPCFRVVQLLGHVFFQPHGHVPGRPQAALAPIAPEPGLDLDPQPRSLGLQPNERQQEHTEQLVPEGRVVPTRPIMRGKPTVAEEPLDGDGPETAEPVDGDRQALLGAFLEEPADFDLEIFDPLEVPLKSRVNVDA